MARHFIPADNMQDAYGALLEAVPDLARRYRAYNRDPRAANEAEAWRRLEGALQVLGMRTYHQTIWDQKTGAVESDPSQGLRFSTFLAPPVADASLPNICTDENRLKAYEALLPFVLARDVLGL